MNTFHYNGEVDDPKAAVAVAKGFAKIERESKLSTVALCKRIFAERRMPSKEPVPYLVFETRDGIQYVIEQSKPIPLSEYWFTRLGFTLHPLKGQE